MVYVQARGVTEEGSSLFGLPQQQQGTATGSGFLVDDQGTILTNAHVVEGSNDVSVSFDENQDPIKAEVKGRDPDTDLAVLKVDPDQVKNAPPVPLGDSGSAEVGIRWWRSATRSASPAPSPRASCPRWPGGSTPPTASRSRT